MRRCHTENRLGEVKARMFNSSTHLSGIQFLTPISNLFDARERQVTRCRRAKLGLYEYTLLYISPLPSNSV